MPLKLLIMIDSLTCGGAEKSLVSLLPFLAARDYDITLMLTGGGMFEKYVPTNVNKVMFDIVPHSFRRILYSLSIRIPGKRNLSEIHWNIIGKKLPSLNEEFDVAIAYQQGFPTFFIAEKVKAKKKICWVNADLAANGYSQDYCRPFYEKYDHIVPVSEILSEKFRKNRFCDDGTKCFCCYDIIDTRLITSMAREQSLSWQSDKIHIVTVGRLVPQKGYDIAIDAACVLKDHGLNFEWHIVGGGPLESKMRESISSKNLEEYVFLEGAQSNPYPYMARADIYAQTSRTEGFGLTVGEAKILGKPIVTTNFPVVYNQITDEKNGLIVEMNGRAVADGIMRLLNDDDLRKTLTDTLALEENKTALTESAKVIELIEKS